VAGGKTDGMPHRAAALEELLLLWTANRNQAFKPFEELFEEKSLAEKTVYRLVTQGLRLLCHSSVGAPSRRSAGESSGSAAGAGNRSTQLALAGAASLIRRLWKPLLGDSLERILQIAGEILHEEELAIWMQFNPPAAQARAAAEAAARRRLERGEAAMAIRCESR